ncbi:hypothetical protein EBB79_10340 [Parasedimentitalea marina]|uniref:Uncharacterized protein n=1 Tax=Parasedimentitalea marina TaxID=2483033 RepID=A0A3T0N2H7_9RHOB|nr:hypothetical protein [Parasedimentitalea marina]AZV78236.1 hypothetical protein EBB79_10340 [Parasedimentitalea marina]
MRNVILCFFAVLITSLAPLLLLVAGPAPEVGSPVLVIASPWGTSAPQVIEQAGLFEIAPERAVFGALTTLSRVGDIENLHNNGAWFVFDGKKVSELCGV